MRKPIVIILSILLALNFLGAADLIRPKINLTSVGTGILVDLDFRDISEAQWRLMIEKPQSFHEFGYGVAGAPGEPALPMITELIPILNDGSIIISNIHRRDYSLQDINLKATPVGHLDSDRQPMQISGYNWDQTLRSRPDQVLPGEIIHMRDQLFLPVTIHPVQVNKSTRMLQIPETIQFVLEGVELSSTSQVSEDGGLRSVSLPEEQFAPKGHYLILTPATFSQHIQYFADWKLRSGYKVSIVTIGANTTGFSAGSIKTYLQNVWDTWEDRPDFLLLVGDEDQSQGVPGHYVQNPQGDNLVTDHPYVMLEGDDTFPEMMVGRLSVDTISELVAFMAKIVAYESSPFMGETEWFQRALMISTTWGAASAEATKRWVSAKLVENGYNQVYTAYHPQVSTTSAISIPINNGVGFVNYRGFGMYNGWFGPDFTNYDITTLIRNGAKTPIITSVVCGGGNFAAATDDPCFGELWTRVGTFSVPKGAVAFFGPSELYTHTQFNNVIDIGIYSGIFDQGMTTLGEALWNGKFELWRNYHQNTFFPFDQTPEFYHKIYNLLGDPGMQLWTATPELLSVSHTDTISPSENSLEFTVNTETGSPVAHAYVALYNEELAIGGYTDASGNISLPFTVDTTETIQLTVTGQNLFPYLTTLTISDDEYPLYLTTWTTSDEGQLVAGMESSMNVELYNPGDELTDVSLIFNSETAGIVLGEPLLIPSIPAQSTYNLDPISISASSDLEHGHQVNVSLEVGVEGISWTWDKYLTVQAPQLSIHSLNLLGGVFNPGDSAQVSIDIMNDGGVASQALTITPLQHDLITYSVGSLSCPEISIDATGSTDVLDITFSEQIFPGEKLNLQFECVQLNATDTLEIELEMGEPIRYGPSQADDYGYRIFDNWDLAYTKAPLYEWIEINPALGGFGTTINMSDMYEEGDASRVLNLPFPVTFYGEEYTQLTVCTNGWAAFGSQLVVNFHNRIIPSPIGPTAMLAPFWDDLTTGPGTVSYRNHAAGEAFIVEWSRMSNLGAQNSLSFQLIIYDTEERPTASGNNDIKFQYLNYENIDVESNFSTVGIESPDFTTGLQASYNSIADPSIGSIRNGSALLFTTDRGTRLPDALVAVSSTSLNFVQNPWSSNRDSIVIVNAGESPLAYNIDVNTTLDLIPPAPAPAITESDVTKHTRNVVSNTPATREGSDEFGYSWKRNTDPGGPIYDWVDIETTENLIVHLGDQDDSSVGPYDIGFEFPFYDAVFSQLYISSNGTFSFMSNYAPWLNLLLPTTAAPSALVAPWWDDLNYDEGPLGSLYFYTNEYDECVITWKDFPQWGTSDFFTFQAILDPYGGIVFQYQLMEGATYSSTVGIQSPGRNMGLTIHYNESTPFEAGTAISIQPPVAWFSATGWSGRIDPGESKSFVVDVQTLSLDPGHYEIPLTLYTSATNLREADIMVGLDVILGQPPPGDLNNDYLINIRDLMKMLDFILLIEDMNEDQFSLADISSDNEVNVIDVVLLVEEILDSN